MLYGALLYGGQLNQATRYPKLKDLISQMQLAMYKKKPFVVEKEQGLPESK
jgi:hypothetical protein